MNVTKHLLVKLYLREKKTYRQIEAITGVTYGTIRNRIIQFGIPRRPKGLHRMRDLTGMRFGKLTAVRMFGRNGDKVLWEAACDCGNVRSFQAWNLQSGHSTSCGCNLTAVGHNSPNWRGVGDISMFHFGTIKRIAHQSKRAFRLSIRGLWKLFLKQNKACALSGVKLHFASSVKAYNRGETTASLDRIDSSKGYVWGNVQWVHKSINKMKSNLSDEHFVAMCRAVASHNHAK